MLLECVQPVFFMDPGVSSKKCLHRPGQSFSSVMSGFQLPFYRLIATIAYFLFMGVTLFFAFYPNPIFLRPLWLCLSILCQFIALLWYSLSYVPFARQVVTSCCKQMCCNCNQNGSSVSDKLTADSSFS
jgi:hypothetical protein